MIIAAALSVFAVAAVAARLAVVIYPDRGPVPRSHAWQARETDYFALPAKSLNAF
ncbi:hypothetical protein ACFQ36_04235 [Arthrobacter sp. GCM10027362]|uniref:hypothetical protein n=1 Tax=Arthrobacter sp. GCM10027362 TaxID=3273379 RepID=UPI0036304581